MNQDSSKCSGNLRFSLKKVGTNYHELMLPDVDGKLAIKPPFIN